MRWLVDFFNAHGLGDGVGDLEAHAAHPLDQQVRIAFDKRQRQVAEFAVDAENSLLADAVRSQAHTQVAPDPAVAHALLDGFDDRFFQPLDLMQPFRVVFQHLERPLAELIDDLLRRFFANALEAPGSEIIGNALAVLGQDELITTDLDLLAEARVIGFFALDQQKITLA